MTYYVIKCNNCGNYNTVKGFRRLANITLKCRRCNKSSKIKSKNKFGLNNEVSPLFDDMIQVKKYIDFKTSKDNTDFYSYKRKI